MSASTRHGSHAAGSAALSGRTRRGAGSKKSSRRTRRTSATCRSGCAPTQVSGHASRNHPRTGPPLRTSAGSSAARDLSLVYHGLLGESGHLLGSLPGKHLSLQPFVREHLDERRAPQAVLVVLRQDARDERHAAPVIPRSIRPVLLHEFVPDQPGVHGDTLGVRRVALHPELHQEHHRPVARTRALIEARIAADGKDDARRVERVIAEGEVAAVVLAAAPAPAVSIGALLEPVARGAAVDVVINLAAYRLCGAHVAREEDRKSVV